MITRVCALSCLLLVTAGVGRREVSGYSQVAIAGSGPANDDGPKVYKALNMDLIYPRTFNSSENLSPTKDDSPPEIVESLSAAGGHSPSDESSGQPVAVVNAEQPLSGGYYTSPPPPPTFFVTPANHANDDDAPTAPAATADESGESAPPPPPPPSDPATAPASGRAVDYRPAYPFSQLLTPNTKGYRPSSSAAAAASYPPMRSRPVSRPNTASAVRRVVYPSYQASRTPSRAEIDKLSGKGYFSDRFTPSEGVVSAAFKRKPNSNRPQPSNSRPIGQPSNKVSTIVAPQDLYSFPPNTNVRYPSPSDLRQGSPSDTVSSYLPPPAGPADGKFLGPVNPDLLPKPSGEDSKGMTGGGSDGYHYDPPPMSAAHTGYQYEPPKAALDAHLDIPDSPAPMKDDSGMMKMASMDHMEPMDHMDHLDQMDHMDSAPAAPSGGGMMDDGPPPDDHDHHGMQHEIGGYVDGKEYPTPPPGYMAEHDHDHDHHHQPDIDFAHGPYFHDHHHGFDHHHYPDIVYDDYHDHHHFHDDHPTMPSMMMTTPPPPPPPAHEVPRVKKYSYFYIGRKLWYIPLYFTVWFTFYVLWLILKSIARHKANLPNHYVSRRSVEELSHREAREAIDKLTVKVMDGIEKFKERFIG